MRALGADAAGKRGWAGVVIDDDGFVSAHVSLTLANLIGVAEVGGRLDAIGIDIPIGLVDAPARQADVAARQRAGSRRASVFPSPHPSVVDLDDYQEVNRRLVALGHPQMSKQGFGLFPRIREAAALALDPRVIEVCPETSFSAMAAAVVGSSKKTWNGSVLRQSLLARARPTIVLPDDLGPAGEVPVDDVLDAAAVAWSSWRYAHGLAEALGDPEERDSATGRRIAVWV